MSFGYAVTGIYDRDRPFLFIEGVLSIPSYSTTIIINLSAQNIGVITDIKIADNYYELGDVDVLEQGQYHYSSKTNLLTINPIGFPQETDNIYYAGLTESSEIIRTTQIIDNIPSFFTDWNIYGSAQFSHDFQGHPTASFEFIVTPVLLSI